MEKTTDICNVSKDATFEMNCCIFFIFLPLPVFIHTKKETPQNNSPAAILQCFLFSFFITLNLSPERKASMPRGAPS